jgi:hypothetical protein
MAGRPRTFDADTALENAMQVFWRKGYEGASLTDLTAAMGINPPSLYAAFGSKEALFRKAMDRYEASHGSYTKGCLGVQGALACGEAGDAIREDQSARRVLAEELIRKRLQRARAEGDLPKDANPADLARYLRAVICGMAVQSADGATRKELQKTAELAMRAWPG